MGNFAANKGYSLAVTRWRRICKAILARFVATRANGDVPGQREVVHVRVRNTLKFGLGTSVHLFSLTLPDPDLQIANETICCEGQGHSASPVSVTAELTFLLFIFFHSPPTAHIIPSLTERRKRNGIQTVESRADRGRRAEPPRRRSGLKERRKRQRRMDGRTDGVLEGRK